MNKKVKLLKSDNKDMRNIVRLLVDFDAKTERYAKYVDVHRHYMRFAIAYADYNNLEFIITEQPEAEFVYLVEATMRDKRNEEYINTSWIHEDGIKMERVHAPKDHPVHNIICLTDMFERGEPILT